MNFIDIIIILLLVYASWKGYKKGFILELFTLLAFFAGLYAAIHFSDFISTKLRDNAGWESEYLPVISFTICFLAVGAMVYFGGKALEKVVKVVQLGLVNRAFGIAFSLLTMTLLIGGLIIISVSFDERKDFISEETKQNSLLYYPILNTAQFMLPAVKESTLFLKNTLDNEPECFVE